MVARVATMVVAANHIQSAQTASQQNTVKFGIYIQYLVSISALFATAFVIGMVASVAAGFGRNLWLSSWSNDGSNSNYSPTNMTSEPMPVGVRLAVYTILGVSDVLLMGVALMALMFGGVLASRNLHTPLIHNLLRSPMSFFDTTPIGRILNRVGKDMETIDLRLPNNLRFVLYCILQILMTLFIIIISVPLFALAVIPLAIIYCFALRYYLATSRQLKRLEAITRSPIYSHFGESMQGASSIRAYGMTEQFCLMSEQKVDTNVRCKYFSLIANRWIAVRLEAIGSCVVFLTAFLAVLSRDWDGTSAGIIGLSVSYSITVTTVFHTAFLLISDLETNIVAVERVKEYCETPTEAKWQSDPVCGPPKGWPEHGAVKFENYSTRYRPGFDLVLKRLNAHILPREKVGVVGRTGAGKSSMALSLFRIIESAKGRILIDGVDISSIGLHDLRSRLTIIPQDPLLFSGTLRINLDPLEEYSDVKLWQALEHAHLKDFVVAQTRQLKHEITEAGENLSVGQRQLVCLARAWLRKSKILVLDEATAAVDMSTDAFIQKTIRDQFRDCTIITVAHRLNTILDYDRVMVLEQGEIREFDSPQNLLANQNSAFYAMAKDVNLTD